jgi:hypothetical protein
LKSTSGSSTFDFLLEAIALSSIQDGNPVGRAGSLRPFPGNGRIALRLATEYMPESLRMQVCVPDDFASSVNAAISNHFSDGAFPLASIQNVLADDCAGGSEGAMKSTSNL